MSDAIKPIPDMPAGLREAALIGNVIPFIGAGASKIAGCPNWTEFADKALEFFVQEGKFSHAQLSQISHLHPRVKLSIALGLELEHKIRIDFAKVIYPSSRLDHQKGRQLYENLSKLGKTFVTTNYDEWLDSAIGAPTITSQSDPLPATAGLPDKPTAFYKVTDLTAFNLNRSNTVLHLHGSLRDPNSMILTTRHYVHHYRNDRRTPDSPEENYVLTFLEHLFTHKNVLFVGYGLEELEILEYVIGKARPQGDAAHREIRHYLLQGFFSHEYEVMRNLVPYYRESGIELIPFLRDQKNWDQLIDVLGEFARQAPASEPMKLEEFREMGELLG